MKVQTNVAARLTALAELLAQGHYTREEIIKKLPVYRALSKGTLERDFYKLDQIGLTVTAVRKHCSLSVTYRLKTNLRQIVPIKERAWYKSWEETEEKEIDLVVPGQNIRRELKVGPGGQHVVGRVFISPRKK